MERVIWSEDARRFWPRAPAESVYLAEAVDLIGRRLFGEDWQITDPGTKLVLLATKRPFEPRPPLSIANPKFEQTVSGANQLDQQRREHESRNSEVDKHNERAKIQNTILGPARKRAGDVKRAIVGQATSEKLPTYYKSYLDGKLYPIPASVWSLPLTFSIFDTCQIAASPWMRIEDRTSPCDIFLVDADLRRIDWTKVEWRPAARPLGEPQAVSSTTEARTEARRPVSDTDLRNWVKERRAEKMPQALMVVASATAFPEHVAPSGNRVKKIDRECGARLMGRPRKT